MKEVMTKLLIYYPLLLCTFVAAIILIYAWLTQPIEIIWVFASLAIALISLGLGLNSILIAVNSKNQFEGLSKKFDEEFQKLQQEIKDAHQKQSDAQSPMVVSMSALSQFLTNWTKQKEQEAKDEKS